MKPMLLFSFFLLFAKTAPPDVNKEEAQKAFVLLNKIRTNPGVFTAEMPFLAEIDTKPVLKWNDTLAAVAESKALDMATRQYMGIETRKDMV